MSCRSSPPATASTEDRGETARLRIPSLSAGSAPVDPLLPTPARSHTHLNGQMTHVLHKVQKIHSELDFLENNGASLSFMRVHAVQDALREVESYKTGSVWLGSLASNHVPAGQAELQEEFEKAEERVRNLVLKLDTASPVPPESHALIPYLATSISAVLLPLMYTLQSIRQQLHKYYEKHGALSEAELNHFYFLEYQLNHLECSHKHNGVWVGVLAPNSIVPRGQAMLCELVEACHNLVHHINLDCEAKYIREMGRTVSSAEKKMWRDLKLVATVLQPVYLVLTEAVAELHHACFLALGADALDQDMIVRLREFVNGLEAEWCPHGVWGPPALPPSGASEAADQRPPALSEVLPGQALLSELLVSFHSKIQRMQRKVHDAVERQTNEAQKAQTRALADADMHKELVQTAERARSLAEGMPLPL
jgi:hypothetical protein